MSIVKHIKEHAQLGIPDDSAGRLQQFYDDVDAEGGALEATVAHRTDTLAALLSITDAPEGEIAVATDRAALVRYSGTPSVGTVFMASTLRREMIFSGGGVSVPASTDTVIPLDTVLYNNGFTIDTSADTITGLSGVQTINLDAYLVFIDGNDITAATLTIQFEPAPDVWVPLFVMQSAATGTMHRFYAPLATINLLAGAAMRFVVQHNSASARVLNEATSRVRFAVHAL